MRYFTRSLLHFNCMYYSYIPSIFNISSRCNKYHLERGKNFIALNDCFNISIPGFLIKFIFIYLNSFNSRYRFYNCCQFYKRMMRIK